MSVNEGGLGKPVALLGLPGQARERVREALAMVGAQIVFEDDPTAIDAAALNDAAASVVVIVLEPAIEDALEALEPALGAPGVSLIFEEAELAERREGWAAQRWARHLAAKLHGHDDVLPPGAEIEPMLQPEPGLPVTPAQLHVDAPLALHLDQAASVLDAVPSDGMFAADPVVEAFVAPPAPSYDMPLLDDPFAAPRVAEPALPEAEPAPAPAAPAATTLGDSSTWGLVEDVVIVPRQRVEAPVADIPTSGLSLIDIDETGPAPGAVLVMAGLGGPDAIRRLLAALPAEFPRPVLVQMTLDGGQYGNLVRQMGRVSALPVALAEPGAQVLPSQVYILPDEVGIEPQRGGLEFVDGRDLAATVAALPVDDSAILMLSGANEALVEQVLALAAQGAWVAGQAADGCYAPAAAARLVAKGMSSGDPVQLAQALAERWKS